MVEEANCFSSQSDFEVFFDELILCLFCDSVSEISIVIDCNSEIMHVETYFMVGLSSDALVPPLADSVCSVMFPTSCRCPFHRSTIAISTSNSYFPTKQGV